MHILRNEQDVENGLAALLAAHPHLVPIARAAGNLPLRLIEPGFAGLAHVIVSQAVSRASANAIWGRMLTACAPMTAQIYADLPDDAWRGFGLSRGKAETLLRIAHLIIAGELDLVSLGDKPPGEALSALTAIKGIGPWTAEVYLMFCCGHADVFPSGDVALQAAYGMAFEMEVRPTARELARESLGWAPWRSIAARLFWAYYAARLNRDILPVE